MKKSSLTDEKAHYAGVEDEPRSPHLPENFQGLPGASAAPPQAGSQLLPRGSTVALVQLALHHRFAWGTRLGAEGPQAEAVEKLQALSLRAPCSDTRLP